MNKRTLLAICLALVATSAFAEPFKSSGTPMPSSNHGGSRPVSTANTAPATSREEAIAKAAPEVTKVAAVNRGNDATYAIVRQHARNYFMTQKAGSNGISVQNASVTITSSEAVAGWPNRLRCLGSASISMSAQNGKGMHDTRHFEAVTEAGQVIDFTAK